MKDALRRILIGMLLVSMVGQIFAAQIKHKPKQAVLAKKEADQMKKAMQASKVQAQNEANLRKAIQASEEEANMRKAMADSLADEVRLKEKRAQEARLKAEAQQRAQAETERLQREAQARARDQAARQTETARIERERVQAQKEAARVEKERAQAEAVRRAEAAWQARIARIERERVQAEVAAEAQRIIEGSRQIQRQAQQACTQAQTGIETARRNVTETERLLAPARQAQTEVQRVQDARQQAQQRAQAAEQARIAEQGRLAEEQAQQARARARAVILAQQQAMQARVRAQTPEEEKEAELKRAAEWSCGICSDNSNAVQLQCGHTYCAGCLTHILDTAIREQEKDTVQSKCPEPTCRSDIHINDVARITNNDRVKITALERIRLAKQPGAKNCPTPNCGHVFIADPSRPRIEQCTDCNRAYCIGCALSHGTGITCQKAQALQEDDKLFNEWKVKNAKACPQCHVAVQKNRGCNHMTCSQCRHEFLWCCLQDYRNGHCICNGAQPRARVVDPEEAIRRQVAEIDAAVLRGEATARGNAAAAVQQVEQRIAQAGAEQRAREAYLVTLQAEQAIREEEARIDVDFANRLANAGKDDGAFEQYLTTYIREHNHFPDTMNRAYARFVLGGQVAIDVNDDNAFADWLARYPMGEPMVRYARRIHGPRLDQLRLRFCHQPQDLYNIAQINMARAYAAGLLGRYGINGVSAVGRDVVYERDLTASIIRGDINSNAVNFAQTFVDAGRRRANGPFEHRDAGPNEYLDAMARGVIRPDWGWFTHDGWGMRVLNYFVEDINGMLREGDRTDQRNFRIAMHQAALRENNPRVGHLSLLVEALNRPQQQRRN